MVASLAGLVYAFDWNWIKSPIERAVSESTGRRFEIRGLLQGEWRLHPRLTMSQVTFANPGWAKNPLLLTADTVEITIALLPLIKRRVVIENLVLRRPSVALERLKDGRATWLFDRNQRSEDTAPEIDVLSVDEGSLYFDDAVTQSRIQVKIQDKPDKNGTQSLVFEAKGTYRSQPLAVQGSTATALALRRTDKRFPMIASGTIAGTQVSIDGEIAGLTRFENVRLRYSVKGKSLRQLAPVFGVPLVETPPYSVSGVLTRSGNRWETRDLKGRVGASDVAGTVVVTTGGAKPLLEAVLTSDLLDLADLGPLIGAKAVSADSAATVSERQRVLPNRVFDLSRISELNAHVKLQAKHVVRVADFPFDNFLADFRLIDAVMSINPVEFGIADGKLSGKIVLDARQPTIASQVAGRMHAVRVAKIFPKQGAIGKAAGTLSGFIDLQGKGNSVAAMLATSSGRAVLLLADGRVPSLIPAIADLDGVRILSSYFGKNPENVRCAAIDLGMKQGIARPNVAVFETDTTVLSVEGTIDLRNEKLAMKMLQAPKSASFLSIRTPIVVSGNLKHPQFALDPVPLAKRGAAALLLGILNPLAAVFALVETGPGKSGTCPAIQRGLNPGAIASPPKSK